MENKYLKKTPMVNYDAAPIRNLIESRGWENLDTFDRIGAIYDYVRNEILFGYNRSDTLTAEEVLADGYGQCNTKATLLMALILTSTIRGFALWKKWKFRMIFHGKSGKN